MQRHSDAKGERNNWDSFWQEVLELVLPDKDDVWNRLNKVGGEQKGDKVFDSSPGHYVELLASALNTMLTPPDKMWWELHASDSKVNEDEKAKKYLQEVVKIGHDILSNSNFQPEIHEFFIDLVTIGTGVIREMPDKEDVVHFTSTPIYEYWIMENHKKRVDCITTEFKMTGRQMLQKYKTEKFDSNQLKRFSEKPNEKHIIQHTILPRDDVKFGKLGAVNMAWASFHIWRDEELLLKESGFKQFPYIVSRWMKVSGEVYGRSPAMKCIHNIRMLNRMMKDVIRSAQKRTDPPMMVPDDGTFPKANINPGGINFYREGSEDKIFALDTKSNPGIGLNMIQEVRQQIKEAFFVDKLQLDLGDRATATEVNAAIDEQLKLFGPQLARLTDEMLQPLIIRLISIMESKGLMPPDSPEILEGVELNVIFSSQIARAQRLSESENFLRFIEASGPVTAIQPETTQILDGDMAIKYLAGLHGVPEKLFRSLEEVEELRQQQRDSEDMEAENAQRVTDSEVLKNAGAGVKSITG